MRIEVEPGGDEQRGLAAMRVNSPGAHSFGPLSHKPPEGRKSPPPIVPWHAFKQPEQYNEPGPMEEGYFVGRKAQVSHGYNDPTAASGLTRRRVSPARARPTKAASSPTAQADSDMPPESWSGEKLAASAPREDAPLLKVGIPSCNGIADASSRQSTP